MSYNLKQAIMQADVVTVRTASGYVDTAVLLSDEVFDNPSIEVVPIRVVGVSDYRYTVEVFIDGEIVEQHIYPDAGELNITHMAYPGKLFPPNTGVSVKAQMKGWDPGLGRFVVRITNQESTTRSFKVCTTHELCGGSAYARNIAK